MVAAYWALKDRNALQPSVAPTLMRFDITCRTSVSWWGRCREDSSLSRLDDVGFSAENRFDVQPIMRRGQYETETAMTETVMRQRQS
jgi:hypothetical protein